MSNRLNQQLEFIKEIDKLKSVNRMSRLINGTRRENTAEHSWHFAWLGAWLGAAGRPRFIKPSDNEDFSASTTGSVD